MDRRHDGSATTPAHEIIAPGTIHVRAFESRAALPLVVMALVFGRARVRASPIRRRGFGRGAPLPGASTPATAALSVFGWPEARRRVAGGRGRASPGTAMTYGLSKWASRSAPPRHASSELANSAYIRLGGSQAHGAVVTVVLQPCSRQACSAGLRSDGGTPRGRAIGLVGDAGRRKIASRTRRTLWVRSRAHRWPRSGCSSTSARGSRCWPRPGEPRGRSQWRS